MERISAHIGGFEYEDEPSIPEVHKPGNLEADMLRIFQCTRDQIAHSLADLDDKLKLNVQVKAYVGKLEPGIFQKLPDNLEHIYTSFPERKIRRETVEIGGKTAKQLLSELKKAKIGMSIEAKFMLNSKEFVPSANREETTLIRLTVSDLGFKTDTKIDQIYKRAQDLGLELCPADTGPNFRLQYAHQSMDESCIIAMKSIASSADNPRIFTLECHEHGLTLVDDMAEPDLEWNPDDEFAFRLRK